MNVIELNNVTREYKIAKKSRSFSEYVFNRKYKTITAVDNISFSVKKGEKIGYIGPNGAGKSTTIKMMTGILTASSGSIKVLDKDPFRDRKINAHKIGVIFGQRTQLWWELPAIDTFRLHKEMYKIPDKIYNNNIAMFKEVLDIGEYIDQPSRQLSLGQRVRLDIALSLLHNPEIIFLDEPTIGLDVVVKTNIRKFIKNISEEKGVTLILTTHDMKDIEEVCDRIVMIDKGKKVIDMPTYDVKSKFNNKCILTIKFDRQPSDLKLPNVDIKSDDELSRIFKFNRNEISTGDIISKVSQNNHIKDITVKEPDIEDIIRDIYKGKIKVQV